MICCDLCEDWYHGTCVSVTKAMGLEMEQKGIDWKCPKCVKKQEEKVVITNTFNTICSVIKYLTEMWNVLSLHNSFI